MKDKKNLSTHQTSGTEVDVASRIPAAESSALTLMLESVSHSDERVELLLASPLDMFEKGLIAAAHRLPLSAVRAEKVWSN